MVEKMVKKKGEKYWREKSERKNWRIQLGEKNGQKKKNWREKKLGRKLKVEKIEGGRN